MIYRTLCKIFCKIAAEGYRIFASFSKLFLAMLLGVGLFCIGIYARQISPGWGIESIGKIIMIYLVCEALVKISENLSRRGNK